MNKVTTDIIKNSKKQQGKQDKTQHTNLVIECFDAIAGDDMPKHFSSKETINNYFVPSIEKFEHIKYDDNNDNSKKINLLRAEYLQRSTKFNHEPSPDEWWIQDNEWESAIISSCELLDKKNSRVILFEPRWADEITFFKHKFSFDNVHGISSFSTNENVISIKDIHCTTFDDNSVDVVYQRNVLSLSYNVRSLLNECVRILKNESILIIDNTLDYNNGVNPIVRTNIHSIEWIIEYLKNNTSKILFNKEQKINNDSANKRGRLIIKIRKQP